MKIICLVKFVPDVDNFTYDYEKNVLVRENVKLILNPEDACALGFALKIKEKNLETFVEVVSMAPQSTIPLIEDLLRLNVDKATLISDKFYVGSDTYVTSKIIAKYLREEEYDFIVTGSHSLDGDTAHIPSQIAEMLQISQLSNIVKVNEESLENDSVIVMVDCEKTFSKYEMVLPSVLSIGKESKYKLPFVKYKDLELDVRDRISVITNEELKFLQEEVGTSGSLTKVNRTFVRKFEKKEKVVVHNDDEGIEVVYKFLKYKGFV
ncbi:electron transfer flavoprotein subunit beta/FixA family protein [Clostridium lacusfryxellense]|uniref:electron transfer flavoprotein subunit beta/FixA family protein n=1 Tax=Clostridium lacusfryxellense TaxID=205328 RepID=UPI001C0D79F9|nr:electron transfer flavoprotein subunit beta/FixA family protein [Clostridium lacusfryxellense]MBU3112075.1 electron transfer flavoprotein subunit beta/FixA family protein [Clostridium lacusfryxellense]